MTDALGSVVKVESGAGGRTFSSNYAPYGGTSGASGSKPTMTYTGQPYDSATGLYLMGARYYDPAIGRFITADSFSGDINVPLSLNRYAYVGDDPETFCDPSGHDWLNDAGNWLSNNWETVAVTVAVVGICVATLGLAVPAELGIATAIEFGTGAGIAVDSVVTGAAVGAMFGAGAYTTVGFFTGTNESPTGALLSAGLGALGGTFTGGIGELFPITGLSDLFCPRVALPYVLGQGVGGMASNFAGEAIVSAEGGAPGSALTVGAFGFAFGGIGAVFEPTVGAVVPAPPGSARSAIVSAGTVAFAQQYLGPLAGVPDVR